MTDPGLADSVGNILGMAIVAGAALWRRQRQNVHMVQDIDDALVKRVNEIHSDIISLKASHTLTQDLVAIHSEKIKEGNEIANDLMRGLDEVKETVEKGQVLIAQFNDYLTRAKAGTLIEKPIEGSGGLTALKKKEET